MRAYTPRAGTIPYRVIRSLEVDGRATTAELLERLNLPTISTHRGGLRPYLGAALRHGYVVHEKRGHTYIWRLGERALPIRTRPAVVVRSKSSAPSSVWEWAQG